MDEKEKQHPGFEQPDQVEQPNPVAHAEQSGKPENHASPEQTAQPEPYPSSFQPYQSSPQPFTPPPPALNASPQPYPPSPQPEPPQDLPPEKPRRRGIAGPLILIFLGLLLLLNNLGLITWSLWEILWRFWPVWLIALGADMLLGRRGRWGGLAVLAILLTLFGGIFYYVGVWTDNALSWQSTEGQAISEPLRGAREARVEIKSGVSRLVLRGTDDPDRLIEGEITPVPGERVSHSYRVNGGTGYYTLESRFQGINIPFGNNNRGGFWDLSLAERTPIALTIETGVGRSEMDLSGLTLTDLRVSTGVGETTVTLPAEGEFRARISAGVGQTSIRIPEGMAARVRVNTGIGGISVRGNFEADGSFYVTPGYDQAVNRVDLTVEGGVGAIRLESVR